VIQASGFTSGDDALDDRETEEDTLRRKEGKQSGTFQVGDS